MIVIAARHSLSLDCFSNIQNLERLKLLQKLLQSKIGEP